MLEGSVSVSRLVVGSSEKLFCGFHSAVKVIEHPAQRKPVYGLEIGTGGRFARCSFLGLHLTK